MAKRLLLGLIVLGVALGVVALTRDDVAPVNGLVRVDELGYSPGETKIAYLMTRAPAPPFRSAVAPVSKAELGRSYHRSCPVGAPELRLLRLSYWGFDSRAHTGSLVVRRRAVADLRAVFARLYTRRFPIRRMEPIARYRGSDNASMAADNTSAFNCRYAVAPGPRRWSAHAYGDAIDVNPVENPYVLGGRARPPAGASYIDRAKVRPGMALRGGVITRAFAAVGWQWGGRWYGSPDYQHFSATGG